MEIVQRKFQSCFFGDFSGIAPTPEIILALQPDFAEYGMIATHYNELVADRGLSILRLRFVSPNQEWLVDFDSGRIDINKQAIDSPDSTIGTIGDFGRNAFRIVSRILEKFPVQGTRLALVSDVSVYTDDEMDESELMLRFVRPIDIHSGQSTSEWISRVVTHDEINLNGGAEKLNVVTDMRRVTEIKPRKMEMPGSLDVLEAVSRKCIRYKIDLNTLAANKGCRFVIDDFEDFLNHMTRKCESINEMIIAKLRGDV